MVDAGAEQWTIGMFQFGYYMAFLCPQSPTEELYSSVFRVRVLQCICTSARGRQNTVKGTLEIIEDSATGFYGYIFLVEKATGE